MSFDKEKVLEVGYTDVRQAGYRPEIQPRFRVQLYTDPYDYRYGPIMLVYDAYCKENPKNSRPIAHVHVDFTQALDIVKNILKAVGMATGANAKDLLVLVVRSIEKDLLAVRPR